MQARPLAIGNARAQHAARTRRLLEKLALALAAAALLCIFLFTLVHLNEAVRTLRTDPVSGDAFLPKCAGERATGGDNIACEPRRN